MNDKTVGGAHWSLWVVGAVAVVWNVMGCINFVSQMNPESVSAMPELDSYVDTNRDLTPYVRDNAA